MTFEEWWEKNANLVYSTSPTAMARRVWEAAISYSRAELATWQSDYATVLSQKYALYEDAERYRHVRKNPAMLLHLSNKDFDDAIDKARKG